MALGEALAIWLACSVAALPGPQAGGHSALASPLLLAPAPSSLTPPDSHALPLVPQAPARLEDRMTDPQARATREGVGLFMMFTLGVLLLFTLLTLLLTLRRQQRRLDSPAFTFAHDAPPALADPWAVAGQRMPIPRASDLERTAPDDTPPPDVRASAPQAQPPSSAPVVPVTATLPQGAVVRTPVGPPVALITAGARRVGRAVALELARCGCDVILTYHRSDDEAQEVAREVASMGRKATTYRVDLARFPEVEAFASQLTQILPRLDVLVHNASTYAPSPLPDLRAQDALEHFSVNALAPLLLTARLLPLLRQSQLPALPCVVAMADIHAMQRPRRDFAAYTMSKAALQEMVMCLSRDLAPHVRVNAVAPGVVAWPDDMDQRERDIYLRRIPLARPGSPDEAARAVRWLALEASYVTGQVIRVDGGRWLT